MKISHQDVVNANIELHTALADKYNKDEPHFRPENVKKVKARVSNLKSKHNAQSLLDIGCGTGFMINIGKELGFNKIVGYDITPAMIDQVDKTGATQITTEIVDVTKTFPDASSSFDMVTAYTFLSHLDDLTNTFAEVCRVLKSGGVFYSDLDPNFYFWNAMEATDDSEKYDPYLQREVLNTKNNDRLLKEKYGIDPDVYNTAEYQKTKTGGMKEEDLRDILIGCGFKEVKFYYNWYVGQAIINNDPNLTAENKVKKMEEIEDYLQRVLPLSRSLYKYISFEAYK